MKLKIKFSDTESADGFYQLWAPDCAAALLSWADEKGALADWTPFASIPIDACGRGGFRFRGGRAVPPEATHIHVRTVTDDLMQFEDKLFQIPNAQKTQPVKKGVRFAVMSDIHLSSKAGMARHVFARIKNVDALLLIGDITNDGTEEQFELLKECIQCTFFYAHLAQGSDFGIKIFPVIGNHDRMAFSHNADFHDKNNYAVFQEWVFDKMRESISANGEKYMGKYEKGPGGAYAVQMGMLEIIGLQAVADNRKFSFGEGQQLAWLDGHMDAARNIRQHLILCHAPLLHHNPKQEVGKNTPYLNRDRQLQEIIDRHGNVIFLSGHTHLSMNHPDGCVKWDKEHKNLYINDGSVRPTDLLSGEPMQPKDWKDGNWLDITINDKEVEIITRSVKSGKKHARGYYHMYVNP